MENTIEPLDKTSYQKIKTPVSCALEKLTDKLNSKTPNFLKPLTRPLSTDVTPLLKWTETHFNAFPMLKFIDKFIGIPPLTFAFAFLAMFVYAVRKSLTCHARLTSNLLGVVYPILASFRSLSHPQSSMDNEKWMTYWSLFGLSTLLDEASDTIQLYTHSYFVPKIFFLYLMSVKNGSLWVYKTVISRFLSRECKSIPSNSDKSNETIIVKEMKDNESQETLLIDEEQEIKIEMELHQKTEVFVKTVMEEVVRSI